MARTHHFIHFKKIKLLYGRVPKVANTSIKHALCTLLTEKPTVGMKTTSDVFWRDYTNNETELLSPLQARKLRKSHFSFTFVRNPFDRLVAAYNNKVIEIESPPKPMQGMGIQHGISFDQFIEIIANNNPEDFDVHIMPQSIILCTGGNLVPKFVGRMEEINLHWAYLRKRMITHGIKVRKVLPHKNLRRAEKQSLRDYYKSDSTIQKVLNVYGDDLKIFYPEVSIDQLIENETLDPINPKRPENTFPKGSHGDPREAQEGPQDHF